MKVLEYGKVYEVLIIGEGSQQHPWHIHGYSVYFTAFGKFESQADLTVNWPSLLDRIPPYQQSARVLTVGDSWSQLLFICLFFFFSQIVFFFL